MRRFAVLLVFGASLAAANVAACDFEKARQEAQTLLASLPLQVSGREEYVQVLEFPNGDSEPMRPHMDYASREIGFALLEMETCTVRWFKESRQIVRGRLTAPSPGQARLAPRAFKPIWNDFNSQTTTGDPKRVVIGIQWVFFSRSGSIFYVPYSEDFAGAFPSLGEIGRRHFLSDMDESLAFLLNLGMIDSNLERELHAMLPLIFASESIDPFEFKAADMNTRARLMEEPFLILGANGEIAYTLKVSSAGARGPMQVYGKSCDDVHKNFPKAFLAEDCNSGQLGSHNHIANIMAAALEYKLHRATLVRLLGRGVLRRHDFSRMMMASYNGGPGHVVKAFRAYGENWERAHYVKVGKKKVLSKNSLLLETVDYLFKYTALQAAAQAKPGAEVAMSGTR